jgi:PadR family transcriptional regulator, regulatory protein PadR
VSHPSRDLLHGTLDLLILTAVRDAPRHGYEIVRHIETTTHSAVVIEDGSLYPALYRLEKKRQIKGEWGVTEGGRRARFYRLTDAGRKALAARSDDWMRFAAGVSRLLLGERS